MRDAPLIPETSIAHYYGDMTRRLFVAVAALSAIAIPIWGELIPYGTFSGVITILVLVLLAGLTNPAGRFIALCNVLVSAVGVVLLEMAAITFFSTQPMALFILREAAALLMLFAFYMSVKTFRAMSLHVVGKKEPFKE